MMAFAGAAIRAWFVARHKAHERGGRTPLLPLALGLAVLAGVIVALAPYQGARSTASALPPAQRFAEVQAIVNQRCVPCHAAQPTFAGFPTAPKGVQLDSPAAILAQASQMQMQLRAKVMPIGNLTQMTDAERATVLAWLADGAPR